jgi:tRNA(Arg) A34 adenosine deaminase TadA
MSQIDHDRYMRLAIDAAGRSPVRPFGAVLIDTASGREVARGWNRTDEDPTLHGEVVAIQQAAALDGEDWGDLTLYTTAEPCPMCASAAVWMGVDRVVYGVSIPFLKEMGWYQIELRASEISALAGSRGFEVIGGVLEDQCAALFRACP